MAFSQPIKGRRRWTAKGEPRSSRTRPWRPGQRDQNEQDRWLDLFEIGIGIGWWWHHKRRGTTAADSPNNGKAVLINKRRDEKFIPAKRPGHFLRKFDLTSNSANAANVKMVVYLLRVQKSSVILPTITMPLLFPIFFIFQLKWQLIRVQIII